jgi:chromate transporter
LREAALVWARIGCLSFGGPAGQIALLHREVVEQRGWTSERRFLQALSFCTLLPGPEAQQLAIYLGWLMHGAAGGVCAGVLFIAPGAAVMAVLSVVYATLGAIPAVDGLFFGLKCAVLALVLQALARMGRRALRGRAPVLAACAAFVALFAFGLPFPAVVTGAGVVGALRPGWFSAAAHGEAKGDRPGLIDLALASDPRRGLRLASQARRAGLAAMALWVVPVAVAMVAAPGLYGQLAWFFSKMAVVTLGGAYAVLAYVAQDAVQAHWLSAQDMLAGLGLAETTPGPLILVLQFVGFLAAYRGGGVTGGLAGSALTLWVTFLPCFAFVFLGAPLIEALARNRALEGALAAVTAAVVGVIANLALWFSLHVVFAGGGFQPAAAGIAGVAGVALFRFRLGVPVVLGGAALLGLLTKMAGLA